MKPQVSPVDMLLFADVVQHHSFTAAARLHGISKQAVSERISKLEAALSVRLLQRTTRALKTTEAGARYHQECLEISRLVERANTDMLAEQAEPIGTLTISAPIVLGRGKLVPVIAAYLSRFPKVRVDLRLADRLVNLVDEGVDVALRASQMNDTGLSVRRLGEVHALFVASPKLINSLSHLNEAEMIRQAPAVTLRESEVWDLPAGAKVKPKSVLCINDLSAITEAVVAGVGIARLPSFLCEPHLKRSTLRTLLGGVSAAKFELHAAYVSKKQLAPKIRSFIDLLVTMQAELIDAPSA